MPSWLAIILTPLQRFLAVLGVAEASQPMAALLLLYAVVTLLVLLLLFILWRRGKGKNKELTEVLSESGLKDRSAAQVAETTVATDTLPVALPVAGSLRSGLRKTAASLLGRLEGVFAERRSISPQQLEELEEILLTADFGIATTQRLVTALEARFAGHAVGADEIYAGLQEEICHLLRLATPLASGMISAPEVIMVIGVNGVGKTTTIGKLASLSVTAGRKVLLAAGDTFRAAAAEQLTIWAERAGAGIVRQAEGGDPAAVAFDAVQAAVARKVDLLIVDTAGRLHTKANLMEELKKVRRVLDRAIPGAPHQTLLVVDATTGQNALVQARLFHEAVGIDGIVLTKIDGTARGGIVVAIAAELKIPVCYVGVGEGVDDLRPFDADAFACALFARNEAA